MLSPPPPAAAETLGAANFKPTSARVAEHERDEAAMLAAADAAEMAAAFRAARGCIVGGDGGDAAAGDVGVGDDDDDWDAFDDGRNAAPAAAAAAAPSPQPQRPRRPFDLEAEFDALHAETASATDDARRARSAAEGPTPEMFEQCQELLQLFGIPYIVAPMEAEAQCAFLDAAGLVDAVATDDNDVFLFGGQRVYRNLFADSRSRKKDDSVEEYRAEDVERELGLTREHLASLAQLLGSDYAEGVGGVGVVNALEVLRAFGPGTEGLRRFRAWMEAPDDVLVEEMGKRMQQQAGRRKGKGKKKEEEREKGKKGKATTKKKKRAADDESADGAESISSSSSSDDDDDHDDDDDEQQQRQRQADDASNPNSNPDNSDAIVAEFKRRHRGARVSWRLPDSFPSDAVAAAYRAPRVDASRSRFLQHPPAEADLRAFCSRAFGWRDDRTDAVLGPALRGGGGRGGGGVGGGGRGSGSGALQQTMHQFLASRQRFAKIRSSRLAKAVAGITQKGVNREIMLVDEEEGERGGGEAEEGEEGGGGRGVAGGGASASASARGKNKRGKKASGDAGVAAAAKKKNKKTKKENEQGTQARQQPEAGRRAGGGGGGGGAAGPAAAATATIDISSSSPDFDSDSDADSDKPVAKRPRDSAARGGGEGPSSSAGGGGSAGGRGGKRGGRGRGGGRGRP
jgi:DNA excision repair protein ERCC-5